MTLSEYAMSFSCSGAAHSVRRPRNRFEIDALSVHLVQRRHLAQPLDVFDHEVRDVVDLFFGVVLAEAEADRAMCQLFVHTQRAQHIARLEAPPRGSPSGGNLG